MATSKIIFSKIMIPHVRCFKDYFPKLSEALCFNEGRMNTNFPIMQFEMNGRFVLQQKGGKRKHCRESVLKVPKTRFIRPIKRHHVCLYDGTIK